MKNLNSDHSNLYTQDAWGVGILVMYKYNSEWTNEYKCIQPLASSTHHFEFLVNLFCSVIFFGKLCFANCNDKNYNSLTIKQFFH